MKVVLMILLGFALFWWWFLFGSSDHCPRCGTSLITHYDSNSPLISSTRKRSCACGWHE